MFRLKPPARAALVLIGIVFAASCASRRTSDASDSPQTDEFGVDEDAIAIVKTATSFIRDADLLQVVIRMGFDVVQSDGQKLEFGETREVALHRPGRARFEYSRRDGKTGVIVFDGDELWVYSPEQNVYASTDQPGDIDSSLELLTTNLGITTPLADLLTADTSSSLAAGLTSCYVVGDAIVAGVTCDHLAVRNDYADYQMWIAKGDRPLIQRIVITYREEPGHPQFWAEFSNWSVGTAVDPSYFVFQPPEGSERIFFEGTRGGE